MKFFLSSLFVAQAAAFAPVSKPSAQTALLAGDYEPMEGEAKINLKVDLEAKKVVNMEALSAGDKKVYCRCWMSGTFPLCDGTHVKHNVATGDNVGPLIVSVPKAE
jgi:CDGSH-type Zn-finger protein